MPLIAFLEDRPQQAGYLLSLAEAASVPHDQIVRTDDGWDVPTAVSDAYTELAALAWPPALSGGGGLLAPTDAKSAQLIIDAPLALVADGSTQYIDLSLGWTIQPGNTLDLNLSNGFLPYPTGGHFYSVQVIIVATPTLAAEGPDGFVKVWLSGNYARETNESAFYPQGASHEAAVRTMFLDYAETDMNTGMDLQIQSRSLPSGLTVFGTIDIREAS